MGDKHQPTGLSATKFEIPNAPVKPARFDYKTGKLLRPGTNKPYDHEASNSSKRKKRGKKKTAKHKERSPEVQHANTPPMVSPSVSPALSPHVVSAIPANTQYGTPTAAVTNLQAHQLDRDAHEQHTNFDLDDDQAAAPHAPVEGLDPVRTSNRQTSTDKAVMFSDKSVRKK